MTNIVSLLKRLKGRVIMSGFWTAIGAMLIPIGALILIEKPTWSDFAFVLVVAGFVSFIAGWVYTIKEERRHDEIEKQRQKEYELREEREKLKFRGEKATFLMLTYMATQLGVDMKKYVKDQEEFLDGE
ncbi:MAG: hypothetical protein A2Z77_02260 [Chloroflexi bacterium RBG_13_51_36]|nr:MAG: hypothetical protein A2Z77_02260 [Chloroflexi bacterium RBG_13_51_36]